MSLLLEHTHREDIRRLGEKDYPAETCGLMGGSQRDGRVVVSRLVPLTNTRTDSAHNRYLIDPDEFRRAQAELDKAGLEIVGVFHSHPDHPAEPSAFDREHAWPHLSYVIVKVERGRAAEIRSWRLADDRSTFHEESIKWQSPS